MIDKIKLLLGLTDGSKDNILNILIEQALEEATSYTHNDCFPELDTVVAKMVVYNYNRLGTEGVDTETFSGVSYDYSTDYPDNIMRVLKANKKAVLL